METKALVGSLAQAYSASDIDGEGMLGRVVEVPDYLVPGNLARFKFVQNTSATALAAGMLAQAVDLSAATVIPNATLHGRGQAGVRPVVDQLGNACAPLAQNQFGYVQIGGYCQGILGSVGDSVDLGPVEPSATAGCVEPADLTSLPSAVAEFGTFNAAVDYDGGGGAGTQPVHFTLTKNAWGQ